MEEPTYGPFDAERERLYRLVDKWIDHLNNDDPDDDDRITVAMIGGIIAGPNEESDEAAAPSFACESKQPHIQVGVSRMIARVVEDGALGIDTID